MSAPTDPSGREHGAIDRRSLLLGLTAGGAALAGATVGTLATRDGAGGDTTVQVVQGAAGEWPWTYVKPGDDIQAAVRAGLTHIQLGGGDYPVGEPVRLPRGAHLRGVGQATRIRAARQMEAVVHIGSEGPVDGVQVNSLVVDCDRLARTGVLVAIDGRDGHYQDEPDPVIRMDDLWCYDAVEDGVVHTGTGTRSCITSRVRVRRAGRHGFMITASDSWWIACEATTGRGGGAGFRIEGANNFFDVCKAWYCGNVGWHVRGTRNKFVGCESQDTGGHGWLIEFDRNTYSACVADTAAMYDVGGTRDGADGFHIVNARESSFVGCQSFDRRPGGHEAQQRYGFRLPRGVDHAVLVGASGWDNRGGLIGT